MVTNGEHYNLISVLNHALHGADNRDHYARDAESAYEQWLTSSGKLKRRRS
jgi:hypothetical protein